MTKNRFAVFAKKELDRRDRLSQDTDFEIQEKLKLSTDFRGSRLSQFFNSDEVALLREFMGFMKTKNYPGIIDLKLETTAPRRGLTSEELALGSRVRGLKKKILNKLIWKTLWSGQGYSIGVICSSSNVTPDNSNLVYICSDLKLRTTRRWPIFSVNRSCAAGVGTLPKDLNANSLKIGVFVQTKDIDRVVSENFETINLEDYLKRLTSRFGLKA